MKHHKNYLSLLVAILLPSVDFGAVASAEEPVSPIRVLILTGSNNHSWRETTPALEKLLEATGDFQVDTTVPPQGITRENLAKYDVILSNWNNWGGGSKAAEDAWTAETRAAYLEFVRSGKGHVTVHAGGCSFYEGWPEYRKVVLIYWNLGATGHGRQHEFPVRIEKCDHPLAGAIEAFSMHDELWNRPGVVEEATVLASAYSAKKDEPGSTDVWEPTLVAATYGKGRCVGTLLGHDAKTMEDESFQQLLIQSVRWAATGKVSSPAVPQAE